MEALYDYTLELFKLGAQEATTSDQLESAKVFVSIALL